VGPSPSGSSLPGFRELWCSGSPVCVVSEQVPGRISPPPRPWPRHGRRRVLSGPQGSWPRWTGPPGPLGWMERCVTQLIPGCGSALGLWIPGLAGWVLLCWCCGPPPHRRWGVGLLARNLSGPAVVELEPCSLGLRRSIPLGPVRLFVCSVIGFSLLFQGRIPPCGGCVVRRRGPKEAGAVWDVWPGGRHLTVVWVGLLS